MGKINLTTKAGASGNEEGGRIRLGGITLYATSENKLKHGLKVLTGAIRTQSTVLPSMDRHVLHRLVSQKLGEDVDDRVFGAVLGSVLKIAELHSIACAAISGKVYRAYVNHELLSVFESRLAEVLARLKSGETLSIYEIRDQYFPLKEWGSYSSAGHLLARLVQLGRAEYVTNESFAWPKGLDHAVQ